MDNALTPGSEPLFQIFEQVRIRITPRTVETGSAGKRGAILGISDGREDGVEHSYAVDLDSMDHIHSFQEGELESLGTFAERRRYYSGARLRINHKGRVIPDDGG
jgi:hypothetical protein